MFCISDRGGGSHPLRVRGLKQPAAPIAALPIAVAPFAGAWIETFATLKLDEGDPVAPFAGAWIETFGYPAN